MKEHELRALVRDAVARHLGGTEAGLAELQSPGRVTVGFQSPQGHASHAVYINLVNVDDACVIEPSVRCNHCNYCRSHGH